MQKNKPKEVCEPCSLHEFRTLRFTKFIMQATQVYTIKVLDTGTHSMDG